MNAVEKSPPMRYVAKPYVLVHSDWSWLCHVWPVGRTKFSSLEANLGWSLLVYPNVIFSLLLSLSLPLPLSISLSLSLSLSLAISLVGVPRVHTNYSYHIYKYYSDRPGPITEQNRTSHNITHYNMTWVHASSDSLVCL